MFGLGLWELATLLVVALVVLGPERLPKVARQLGRYMRELRRAAHDFQTNFTMEASREEQREAEKPYFAKENTSEKRKAPASTDSERSSENQRIAAKTESPPNDDGDD